MPSFVMRIASAMLAGHAALAHAALAHTTLTTRPTPRSCPPSMRMPDGVLKLLPVGVKDNLIFSQAAEANWDALRSCYPTEEAGLAAIERNLAVILPYGADSPTSGFQEQGLAVDRSDKIAGSFDVLREKLDDEADVLDVITKNPGVLGCVPEALDAASADDIRRAASVAGGLSSVFGGVGKFLSSQEWWDEGAAKKNEPKPEEPEEPAWDPLLIGTPFERPKKAEDDDGTVFFPTVMLEGEEYMYDLKGDYNGVEHVLLNMEGEAVGVWNPETQEPEEVEFTDPEE